ncbi:NAD(P)/FAD-dependent oxidoreductase [Gordonia sp. NPDC003424]
MPATVENFDAIVVGTRCAGNAAAVALAERGLRVLGIDAATFPSDTLSTHLLWPATMAEIHAIGALARVEAIGAPRMPIAQADLEGIGFQIGYSPYNGFDYAMCARRTALDDAFVATSVAAGADIRPGCRATELIHERGRVAGVRYVETSGVERDVHAPLIIGADGRKSLVAAQVHATEPYRSRPSGRACYFAYWSDPRPDLRHIAAQWRVGGLLGTAFPCDRGDVLCLLQPPVGVAPEFKGRKAKDAYLRGIEAIPGLAERLVGAELKSTVRACTGMESYFRHSAGPGWALAGDAGHFKDPVTAQGIRDALRYGRLLGEAVAPILGALGPVNLAALDAATRGWARQREIDCLEIYQWTNLLAAGEPPTPIEYELYRRAAADPEYANIFTDVFSRTRRPADMTRLGPVLGMTARAFRRPDNSGRAVLADLVEQGRRTTSHWVERQRVTRSRG